MRFSRRVPIETLAPFLLDVPHPGFIRPDSPLLTPGPPVDWRKLFGNDHPVEIEVGFGKGLFLLQQGQARPHTNFLGIEIERKYTLFTASRIARRELSNVKLACTDARWFLKERVAEASVFAIHVYFPDPWWKQRHKKRKLFTKEFVTWCARALRTHGRLHFVSDVQEYFNESIALLQEVQALHALTDDGSMTKLREGEFLTNFERKYRLEGRPIYRAIHEKTSLGERQLISPLSLWERGRG